MCVSFKEARIASTFMHMAQAAMVVGDLYNNSNGIFSVFQTLGKSDYEY